MKRNIIFGVFVEHTYNREIVRFWSKLIDCLYFTLENKRHLKTPKKVSFNLNILAQETSQDVSKRSLINSFSKGLFSESLNVQIIQSATGTKFMQGMVRGTLHPKEYGGYMVQDIAYLFHAVKALQLAAKQIERQNPIFGHFYMTQAEKYNKYYQVLLKTWRLDDAESVALGTAAKTYVLYQSVLSQEDPRYLSIAMLPCTMLWRHMARELIGKVEKTSLYIDWFNENFNEDPDYQGSLERFVDKHFTPHELKKANSIFCEGMLNELNFFREACGEDLLTLDAVCGKL